MYVNIFLPEHTIMFLNALAFFNVRKFLPNFGLSEQTIIRDIKKIIYIHEDKKKGIP